jgi:hypothetical protein
MAPTQPELTLAERYANRGMEISTLRRKLESVNGVIDRCKKVASAEKCADTVNALRKALRSQEQHLSEAKENHPILCPMLESNVNMLRTAILIITTVSIEIEASK